MKIADITPGLYSWENSSAVPDATVLVLAGENLYCGWQDRSATTTQARVNQFLSGAAGVLCAVAHPRAWDRLPRGLSESGHLTELCEAIPDIRRLALEVSIEAAELRANEIVDLGYDVVRLTIDINPRHLVSPRRDLLAESVKHARRNTVLADIRHHDFDAASADDGIHLRLTLEDAERLTHMLGTQQ